MIIIETCPVCGHDLQDLVLTTYPPIPKKMCFNCGWSWTGKREEVVRLPFGGGNFEQPACINCPSNPRNGGDGVCCCTLGQQQVTY